MRAGHRTSTGRRGTGGRPRTRLWPTDGPDEGTAHRPTPDGSGIAEPTCLRGYRNRSHRTPRIGAARADTATTPDTSRHPGCTPGNVSTSGRVVQTSKHVACLALGTTSARYGEQVPTPHYGQPRYRTIADELRKRIKSGAIVAGALLPAESVLTADFRVSRGTIRQAIAVLRDEGLVATEHGRGTYANPQRSEIVPHEGLEPEMRQRHVSADPELAAIFAVEVGASLIEQQRISRTDGAVRAVIRTYRPI
ncbi:GntR family transcriptional regulator [Micromonospora matsumotoense]|uniref:GntR family transcriptional regulator n=1 Tax=Micromonospora matsumotoense TaxID=121616 RepID=UPI0033F710E4